MDIGASEDVSLYKQICRESGLYVPKHSGWRYGKVAIAAAAGFSVGTSKLESRQAMKIDDEWWRPLLQSTAKHYIGKLTERLVSSDSSSEMAALASGDVDSDNAAEKSVLGQKFEDIRINGRMLHAGDVLAAVRAGGVYQHFGVYAGNGRVIHYAAENGDFAGRIFIHEADLENFIGNAELVYVLDFPENAMASLEVPKDVARVMSPAQESPIFNLIRSFGYHLYSPEETVARARSRLGEEKYSLPFNNCEHFAIWCKTGVRESHQVNVWLSRLAERMAGKLAVPRSPDNSNEPTVSVNGVPSGE